MNSPFPRTFGSRVGRSHSGTKSLLSSLLFAMPSPPIHNGATSRVDIAVAELRKAIAQRQLLPGEPLRLEALSQKLNMSVQPIREAIRLLEAEGLVERSNNRGSVVAKMSLAEVIDLSAVRTIIEPMLVAMATLRASDDELSAIRKAHENFRDLVVRGNATEDLIQLSIDWHQMIYGAAQSRHLREFVDQVWTAIRINSAWGSSLAAGLIDEHEEIISAMEARDHARAAGAMRRHVRDSVVGHIDGFTGENHQSLAAAMLSYENLLADFTGAAGMVPPQHV